MASSGKEKEEEPTNQSLDNKSDTAIMEEQEVPKTTPPRTTHCQEKYQWPCLYEECRTMLAASVLIYGFVELRNKVRTGEIADQEVVDCLMTLPLDRQHIVRIMKDHDVISSNLIPKEEAKMYMDAASKEVEERQTLLKEMQDSNDGEHANKNEPLDNTAHEILFVDDENNDTEAVYALAVDHALKRIEIIFRGSVTTRDFLADLDPRLGIYRNPVKSIPRHPQLEMIGIHMGFAVYLNGSPATHFGEGGKCAVIKEKLLPLIQRYPTYKIYTSGHSLGGALATLMAFDLANMPDVPKPVTCISVASPKAGNISFRHAVQALEKMGKLRCLRVMNKYDLITNMPNQAHPMLECFCGCFSVWIQKHRYWHVGAKIMLCKNGSCRITYKRQQTSYLGQVKKEVARRLKVHRVCKELVCNGDLGQGKEGDLVANHSCLEYMNRLESVKDELKERYLQEFYFRQSRMSVVGQGQ